MDLRFECGWLAGERGWVDASVVVPSELGVQEPRGGPLVVEAAAGSLNVADAKVIGALIAAGRQCLVVSEEDLAPELSAWMPTESIQIAGGPRNAADDVRAPFVDPGFADYLNLGPMGEDEGEELLSPDPEVARLLSGMSVRFAWDRPILWLSQIEDGGAYTTVTETTSLELELRRLFRDADLSVADAAGASRSAFVDSANDVDKQREAFGVGERFSLRESEAGSPLVYLSVVVGSGQALLACTFSEGGKRVYFSWPETLDHRRWGTYNEIATDDYGKDFHGLPRELASSPRAQEVVEGILGSVATGIYCAVVAYGMRQLILNTDVLDRKLQEAWQQSIVRVAGG